MSLKPGDTVVFTADYGVFAYDHHYGYPARLIGRMVCAGYTGVFEGLDANESSLSRRPEKERWYVIRPLCVKDTRFGRDPGSGASLVGEQIPKSWYVPVRLREIRSADDVYGAPRLHDDLREMPMPMSMPMSRDERILRTMAFAFVFGVLGWAIADIIVWGMTGNTLSSWLHH